MALKDLPSFIDPGKNQTNGKLSCLLCGRLVSNLSAHVYGKHSMNPDKYKELTGYTGPFVTFAQAKKMGAQAGKPKVPLTKLERYKNYVNEDEYSLRTKLYERANGCCEQCGISEDELLSQHKRGLHLHHKTYSKTVPDLDDVLLLCSSCHSKTDRDIFPKYNKVCKAVTKLLEALEVDLMDENFRETPGRMATYFIENFLSDFEIQNKLEEYASSIFPNKYDGMVLMKDTTVIGMCPHHLLPIFYKVSIAYLPTKTAIGLSKLHRIAEAISKTPLMQETYTVAIVEYLQKLLDTENVAVRILGVHTCMTARGVRVPEIEICTTELGGSIYE